MTDMQDCTCMFARMGLTRQTALLKWTNKLWSCEHILFYHQNNIDTHSTIIRGVLKMVCFRNVKKNLSHSPTRHVLLQFKHFSTGTARFQIVLMDNNSQVPARHYDIFFLNGGPY
jgi:hypothetical protein